MSQGPVEFGGWGGGGVEGFKPSKLVKLDTA